MLANTLLRGSNPVTINSAVDKNDYFLKELYKLNKSYREGKFEVITNYISDYVKIETKNKYGICSTTVQNLRAGSNPNIKSAMNKTGYWINYAKDHHNNFNIYSFENSIYVNNIKSIVITCKTHGDFNVQPSNCISRNQGCPKCTKIKNRGISSFYWTNKSWIDASLNSEYFDSFKVYILHCWNEEEEFYKIGKTFRSVIERFKTNLEMPYEWEVVDEYICENASDATELESTLKAENRKLLYIPLKYFGGHTECFKNIDTKCTYGKIWRKLQEFN